MSGNFGVGKCSSKIYNLWLEIPHLVLNSKVTLKFWAPIISSVGTLQLSLGKLQPLASTNNFNPGSCCFDSYTFSQKNNYNGRILNHAPSKTFLAEMKVSFERHDNTITLMSEISLCLGLSVQLWTRRIKMSIKHVRKKLTKESRVISWPRVVRGCIF